MYVKHNGMSSTKITKIIYDLLKYPVSRSDNIVSTDLTVSEQRIGKDV